ncbi:hypothetical protein [Gloeobacter violaceus]|uniref:Glr3985 protein n=1 Tax=Gloeobacter violaceus (strain ATCC 29082 / PCC 7421) TaxID=251221 RepID=Q7NE95_GLOVI|nr:hypothetical protein [Gloeobacter violaceus]BAC91926.1 glr3985 [Gloeobacter violaceus PCC 7421]
MRFENVLGLLAWVAAFAAQPTHAQSPPSAAACRQTGLATLRVVNEMAAAAFVEVENVGRLAGILRQEIDPGQALTAVGCTSDQFVIRVYTARQCGRAFVAQSEALRVEGEKTVTLYPSGLFDPGCALLLAEKT